MTTLEIRLLGEFELRRDGLVLPLPPSRKTRALLAYLSLQPRRFSREHLCELLWDVPDDPRGSLRWSLSKLRRLVDDETRVRLLADRRGVGIDTEGVSIDLRELTRLVAAGLDKPPLATLEAAAAQHRGNLLEGLDFSHFHEFHSWCVAAREQFVRDRSALLIELVRRLAHAPERALPHARALVGMSPYDEGHRATLITLLVAAKKSGEAEEQYQLGLRMLKEAAVSPSGAMLAARRASRFDPFPGATPLAPLADLPAADDISPGPHGLHGREAETALIAATLDKVAGDGRAALLLLIGDAGIGKTRLLEMASALARAGGAFVLQAAAFESDAMRPLAPWIDALRAIGADASGVIGEADVANRDRLLARLSGLVARESAERPVVLLFDDAQWWDESSAAALHYVARMNRGRRLFGLVAARDGELRDNAPMQQAFRGLRRDGLLRSVDVGPLSGEALMRLIDERAPGSDAARLSVACGGNPLLAIELALAEARGSSGASLDELVRERLTELGVARADVLRWSAVLGNRVELGTLVRLSGLDVSEVDSALENAVRHGLLRAGPQSFMFSHEMIARAVYNEISPMRRQVMHRRIAELLQADTAQDQARAADLAHHATLSGDAGLAARALVLAGRLCLRFFANDDAMSLARKGLKLAELLADPARVSLEIDLHDILLAAEPLADREAAATAYSALAERALDHGALVQARLGYQMAAYVRWTQGDWTAAREQTLHSVRAVRGGHDEAEIVGMAETAKCLAMIERDLPRADALLMEASALAERKGFSHHAISAGLGMLRFYENRLAEAEEFFRQARAQCKAAGDRVSEYQANEYLVMLELQRGGWAAACEGCAELLALGDKLRDGSEEPFARALAGLCTYAIDDRTEDLDAAIADLRIADAKHRLAYVLTRAALLDCERRRPTAATGRATEALKCATVLDRMTEMLLANAVLAHGNAIAGDQRAAAKFSREVERIRTVGAATWAGGVRATLAQIETCAALAEGP